MPVRLAHEFRDGQAFEKMGRAFSQARQASTGAVARAVRPMIIFHARPRTARRRLLGLGAALSAQRPACLLEAMSCVRDRACVCRPDDRSVFPSRAGALDRTDYSPKAPVAKQVARRLQLNRHVSAPLLIHSLGPAPLCHFLLSRVCSFLLRWTTKIGAHLTREKASPVSASIMIPHDADPARHQSRQR